jgi:hypothetical protein
VIAAGATLDEISAVLQLEKAYGTLDIRRVCDGMVALLDAFGVTGKVIVAGAAVGGAITRHFAICYLALPRVPIWHSAPSTARSGGMQCPRQSSSASVRIGDLALNFATDLPERG